MKKNKKGQTALLSLMLGVFIFFTAMTFIDPMTDVITEVRGVEQLNCSDSTISDGQKATCLIVDLILPYFIAVILAIAGATIGARWIA